MQGPRVVGCGWLRCDNHIWLVQATRMGHPHDQASHGCSSCDTSQVIPCGADKVYVYPVGLYSTQISLCELTMHTTVGFQCPPPRSTGLLPHCCLPQTPANAAVCVA